MPRLDRSRPMGARYPLTRGEFYAQVRSDRGDFWSARHTSRRRHDEKLRRRMEGHVGCRPSQDHLQSLFHDVPEEGLQGWRGSRTNGGDVRSDDTATTHEGLRCEVERYAGCRQSEDHVQGLFRDLPEEDLDLANEKGAFGILDAPVSLCFAAIFRPRSVAGRAKRGSSIWPSAVSRRDAM